ncbi:asparaginase-domain-containing protein, partial [Rhodotorula sp. JG-1b]
EARVLVLYTGGTIGMLKTESGGFAPHSGFLASKLSLPCTFHDPAGESVFANSSSVGAFNQWSAARSQSGTSSPAAPPNADANATDPHAIRVETSTGPVYLPSLVTPRFAQGKRIRYAIYEYDPLIDSSEIEPTDWINIATDIERNYQSFDGFIVLHGTDTLAFSASALSFLLEDLGRAGLTVVLTGAQIPLSELFTDGAHFPLGSLIIAGHYIIPEVLLFFDNSCFRGNRAVKVSSEDFHAFQSFNLPALATVGIDVEVAWQQVLRPGPRRFRAHKTLSSDVATLRLFPGITGRTIRAFLQPGGVRGVVLESYGAGNAPRREELLSAFREATERGVVIVNVTQCDIGAVSSDIYETGRALAAVGIVGGGDMTTECALAKLAYLLSKPELSPTQIRTLLSQPLRGELTPVASVPAYSSPYDTETRLRTLFSQLVACGPSAHRSVGQPAHHTVPSQQASEADPTLPEEFGAAWPSTLADEACLKSAVMPYLLSQAASRPDHLLETLIASLDVPDTPVDSNASAAASAHPLALPALLNEPATVLLQTPLHLAVLAALPQKVKQLLSHGASVHARDTLGHSPLFYAAKHGGETGLRMVRLLRAAGAHLG